MKVHLLASILDGAGLYGGMLHFALCLAFVGSALLFLVYFWKKGRLDMDEGPKWQMMEIDEEEEENEP
jgi:hypothetical protein